MNLLLDVAATRNLHESDHLALMDHDGKASLHKAVTSGILSVRCYQ